MANHFRFDEIGHAGGSYHNLRLLHQIDQGERGTAHCRQPLFRFFIDIGAINRFDTKRLKQARNAVSSGAEPDNAYR